MRDVSGDIRTLKQDLNSILESLGTPGGFFQEYRTFYEESRHRVDRFQTRLDSLEAVILLHEECDAKKKEYDVSEDSVHLSVKRNRHKPKRVVHIQEDSSDSDWNHSSSSWSSGSSDSEDGRRRSLVLRSKATYPSQVAIRSC